MLIERSKLAPRVLPRVNDRTRLSFALARKFAGAFCAQLGKLDVELRLDPPGFGLAFGNRQLCQPRNCLAELLRQAISRHQVFVSVHRCSKPQIPKITIIVYRYDDHLEKLDRRRAIRASRYS